MIEEVKRAIDNNDVNKLYACNFFIDSSIKEYILKNKKRIINNILNLKLWLDDEIAVVYFNDNDFIKASIMASNIDVARLFNNNEINRFLVNNMDHIISFMNKRIYNINDKTPKVLLNNINFVNLCLDNGFLNVLDYGYDNGYYLKNKDKINRICYEKIVKGIVRIDEFSSKRMLLNSDFLIGSILSNNYNVLLFSTNIYLDKYIENNIKNLKEKLEDYIRSNNYFINENVDIKLPYFLSFYKNFVNSEIKKDSSIFKMMDLKEFSKFVLLLEDNVILDVFGKKIFQLYLFFGISLFEIGYDKICLINEFSITEYEKFVKIFCFNGNIKIENVRSMYFNILASEFELNSEFNANSATQIENMIDKDGIINLNCSKKIDCIKNILGQSYYDYLVSLINNNIELNVDKTFSELIDDVFDSYRRAVVALDDEKKNKIHNIINGICKVAYEREFDLFASSKMNFNDGYPFLVEPSDIYIKRFYKERKLDVVKKKYLDDNDDLNELCIAIYDKSVSYDKFVKAVKKYLKTDVCNIYGVSENVDKYLSKYISNVDIENIEINYFNLPLTDEYLKTSYNRKTILNVIKGINIKKLRIMLNDYYNDFKSLFYDKQVLYMLDTFNSFPSYYNISNVISLIDNFCLVSGEHIYEKFKSSLKYSSVPSLFNSILGSSINLYKNDSKVIGELLRRSYNAIKKRKLPIPDLVKKYLINNHEITVSIGGYDYNDVFLPMEVESDVFAYLKYDWLHNYVFSNENGFVIKLYDNKLIGLVFGIRYGNTIFLSNLSYVVHSSYIIESIKKFSLDIVNECKKNNDNLGHIYLSNFGSYNKIYSLVNGLVSGLTDYDKNGLVLYDNLSKINSHCLKKYPINNRLFKGNLAYERALNISIIDLFGHSEDNLINDVKVNGVTYAGRSWYKCNDIFVAGTIDDSIIEELSAMRKGL